MIARRILICLLALAVPLVFGALGSAAAADISLHHQQAAAMASMPGCNEADPSMPAKPPACAKDCALLCATVILNWSPTATPVRPYEFARYDFRLNLVAGLARKPELPPPRVPQLDTATLQSI